MLSKIETLAITVSAHRDAPYRSVEECARRQWADLLATRAGEWSHAGLQLVDSQHDTDVVGHLIYRFQGVAISATLNSEN